MDCSSILSGPGSSVGIATGYGLDGPRMETRWRRDFPHLSRPALGSTQSPVQWVSGSSRGVKSGRGVTLTPHPLLVPWSWKGRVIPLLTLWAVRPIQSLSACTSWPLPFFSIVTWSLKSLLGTNNFLRTIWSFKLRNWILYSYKTEQNKNTVWPV